MSPSLLAVSIGYGLSAIITFGFGLFVLFANRKVRANQLFFAMCAVLFVWQVSFLLGSVTAQTSLSYIFWFFNISNIFLILFIFHFLLVAVDAHKKHYTVLKGMYVTGGVIFALCLIFPDLFLPAVAPKLYFYNYLVGGPLYAVMLWFFMFVGLYNVFMLVSERRRKGAEGKKRIDYYIFSNFYGTGTGITAFPLVFGIPINPILSIATGLFIVPIAYGIVKRELLDIRVVIRRTVISTAIIGLVSGLLTLVSFLSNWLAESIPGFEFWMVPVGTAFVSFLIGSIYWKKAQEAEKLKYEFITVATHKLRTPLTRVRWAVGALSTRTDLPDDVKPALESITQANLEMIETSNLLVDAARTEKSDYQYSSVPVNLRAIVENILSQSKSAAEMKQVTFDTQLADTIPDVLGDKERIGSVVRVFIENAIAYSPEKSVINVSLSFEKDTIRFSVTDKGIGFSSRERAYIFKKFFRTDRAKTADTEGLGIGLYMAKNIIERHRGTLEAESPGIQKGSTFWFTLPVPKSSLQK